MLKQGFQIKKMPRGFRGYLGGSNQIYIGGCVLSGPYRKENGKPAYLQSKEYSRRLNIVGGRIGLILNFALGKEKDIHKNRTVTHYGTTSVEVPADPANAYYVWAELADDGYSLGFGLTEKDKDYGKVADGKDLQYSFRAPSSPKVGDYWFDFGENHMKIYRNKEVEKPGGGIEVVHYWEKVRRIILGWIGIGWDGYIYSMTSFPMNHRYAKLYPELIEYDGVSFLTDGEYIARSANQWVNNEEIAHNVSLSSVAMDTVVNSPEAMASVAASPVAMAAIAASPIAVQAVVNSLVATDVVVASPVAMEAIAASAVAMELITTTCLVLMEAMVMSTVAMQAVAASPVAAEKVAASLGAMGAVIGSQIAVNAVIISPTAMEAISASQLAMDAVVASSEVMAKIAAKTVALNAIFNSWVARLVVWNSEMASRMIMDEARAWLEGNVAETAYRQSGGTSFETIVDKKGLLLAIKCSEAVYSSEMWNGSMRVFKVSPAERTFTNIAGSSLTKNRWYDTAHRMTNFQVANKTAAGSASRVDFRYVPMEP